MKTSTEAKKITREIAELLPRVSKDVKNEMLIILRWENANQNEKKSEEEDAK